MTALTYSIPTKTRLECANVVCTEDATFLVHWANEKTPCCLGHLSQFERSGARLEKLLIAGKANTTEGDS